MAKFVKKGVGTPSIKGSGKLGCEPVGRVRRSQLISTYGIGAIIDLEKGSFMPLGLDDWEPVTKVPSLSIAEERLQQMLEVDHFRMAPVAKDIIPGQVDPWQSIPVVRFPEWHQCPSCLRIGREGEPFELATNRSELQCSGHDRPVVTTPVRFVLACARGHVEDFPWVWWAHKSSDAICNSPKLALKSAGKSAALADLFVNCKSCGASESMGDAFRPEALRGRKCRGSQPWLHSREAECAEEPKVIQRGASNAHFPVVASALTIPPASAAAFKIINELWHALDSAAEDAVDHILRGVAKKLSVDAAPLLTAYREKKRLQGENVSLPSSSPRRKEYEALCQSRVDDEEFAGIQPQFRNSVSEVPRALAEWFDIVGAVSRLREVRALAGFTRIEPYPVSPENIPAAIRSGRIAALSRKPKNWLPAAEIRGEGIFLRFRTDAIDRWVEQNKGVSGRADRLEQRSEALAKDRDYDRDYQITPRLLLVHSFAHALIRTISLECGYSSSSIRERLFVAEQEDGEMAMNGVLLYTGSPDSEGSLGGLVRLAEPELLVRVVMRAIRSARWCGSDPVCLETDPAQSGERISGAACHCCLLAPETSCEKFNRELDRTMLVGSAPGMSGDVWPGFFDLEED
ncbi:DUF1998 domain-containing protein [Pseudomonas veronii]|uniref:DUF1998 domain-containing protein n=1 Tax=Pseudomonas veronii TaxID=76761 RepID=UPI0015A1D73F|nr:DUF1998 domain-containing protein [Pseudomonas veronii]NWC60411.1 DUF1998 domain-containing protein [Pseudomonas veronii]